MSSQQSPNAPRVAAALELRIRNGPLPAGCLDQRSLVVKKGPQVYKTVELLVFGNAETGEIRKRMLRVRSWGARIDGPGYAFDEKPESSWYCENDEVDALGAFISGRLDEPGLYQRIDSGGPLASIIEKVKKGDADAVQLEQLAQALADAPNAAEVLSRHGVGRILLDGIQATQQRDVIAQLKVAVDDPSTPESTLQSILDNAWWMFGGRFIDKAKRRNVTVLDQLDIPLIRPDGALHVIELKTAYIPDLIVPYRNHYIVGPRVNEAVGQTLNYLRSLDEQRHTIKNDLGIECRRAFATVVIGHSRHVRDVDSGNVGEVLRTYNSHLARVEVITYEDLIVGAESALNLRSHESSEDREPESNS